jgi:hypothetical protein
MIRPKAMKKCPKGEMLFINSVPVAMRISMPVQEKKSAPYVM